MIIRAPEHLGTGRLANREGQGQPTFSRVRLGIRRKV